MVEIIVKIRRIENSLGFVIPNQVIDKLRLGEGDKIEVQILTTVTN